MQSTTDKKKVKQIIQTKRLKTCLKLMINELLPTGPDNVYFANNEQASIAVFTAGFVLDMPNII